MQFDLKNDNEVDLYSSSNKMATASFSTIAKDDLSCPVCYELLTDPHTPKLLDCPHICCAVCIQKMIEGGKYVVECPECRHLTCIPNDGVEDMRTVLQVRSLAEKHKEMRANTLQNAFHAQRKKTGNIITQKCSNHHATVAYFCRKCNITGCYPCMIENHSGPSHDYVKIQEELNRQREELDEYIKCISAKKELYGQRIKELDDVQLKIQNTLSTESTGIKTRVDQFNRQVREMGQIMISGLRKKTEPRLERISFEIEMFQMNVQESLETMATVKKEVYSTAAHELITCHNHFAKTVHSIAARCKPRKQFQNPVKGVARYDMYKKSITKKVMKNILCTVFPNKQLKCEYVCKFGVFKSAIDVLAIPQLVLVNDKHKHKHKIHIFDKVCICNMVLDDLLDDQFMDLGAKRLILRASPHPTQGIALNSDGDPIS